ncbi:MAG: hypothetical protein ACYCO9_00370 [Streptosporangiaceae bacterium]
MLLGAALEVVAAAVFALTGNTMAPFFAKRSAGQGSIHAQIIMQDKVQVPVYLVAALSWLILAAANRRSAGGARIWAAIAFAICALGLGRLIHPVPEAPPNSAATIAAGLLIWLAGLAVVVLLFGGDRPRVQQLFRLAPAPGGSGEARTTGAGGRP